MTNPYSLQNLKASIAKSINLRFVPPAEGSNPYRSTRERASEIETVIATPMRYGRVNKTDSFTLPAADTAYAIEFTDIAPVYGITLSDDGTRIYFEDGGLYRVDANFQLSSTDASSKLVYGWHRENGVDCPRAGFRASIKENGTYKPVSRTCFVTVAPGDYIEVMIAVSDVSVTLAAAPATAFAPPSQSVAVEIQQVHH